MLPPISITFTLNGSPCSTEVAPEMCAADFIREQLGLTGTKVDCKEGECGSCTILFNGDPVCSCLMTAAQLDGGHVVTVEGIAHSLDHPHEIQTAFVTEGAVQCGHCIPGMIVSAAALLEKTPTPTEEEIRQGIAGNICRCTGYAKIVTAIQRAAVLRSESAAVGSQISPH